MCKDLLNQSSLFSGISPTERQNIADKLTAREYPPRALIFSEGDSGNSILIICQGEVEIIKAIGTQEERLRNLLKDLHNEEDFMGELVTSLKNFAGPGWEKDDDLTMVLLRRH